MPELPEVETIVRGLAPRLTGRSLRNPRLFKSDVLRGVSARRLLGTLRGNRIHDNGNIRDDEPPRIAGDDAISISAAHDVILQQSCR